MNNFVCLLTLVFLNTSYAKDADCILGKIRYIDKKSEMTIQENYCYDSLTRKIYSSGRCKPNTKCLADIDNPIPLKLSDVKGEKGSPGFKVCDKVSGVPQIIEFWDGEKWIKTSRCVFSDGSYIDIGSLETKIQYIDSSTSTKTGK